MIQKQNIRIEWVDIAKFLGIFCMVWGHAGVSPNIDIIIHVFHMPIFFFLSGYLFKMERFSVKKKITSLLVPYFIFGAGLFIIWKIISKIITLPEYYSIKDFMKGIFYDNTMTAPYACIQWFLTCLFLTEILFYCVRKGCRKDSSAIIILILISIIGFIFPKITNIRLFWGADCAFTAIAFFGIGYYVKKFKYIEVAVKIIDSMTKRVVAIFLLAAFGCAIAYKNGYVNMRTMQYGNYLLYYISAIALILAVIGIGNVISHIAVLKNTVAYKLIIYIGQNTIIVLVMNQFFNRLLSWFIKGKILIWIGGHEYLINFVLTILIFILMLPFIYIINKFFPFVLGRKGCKRSEEKNFFE